MVPASVPELSALSTVAGDRIGQPSSASGEEQFVCDRTLDEVTFRWSVCLSRGDLTVELLGEGGQRLKWPKLTGNDNQCWTDHFGRTLAQGQVCRLRCVDAGEADERPGGLLRLGHGLL